jgi:putative flippase GtrA
MRLYLKSRSSKLLCYGLMGLTALIAFAVFMALPMIKGVASWYALPVVLVAAVVIAFIQNSCSEDKD